MELLEEFNFPKNWTIERLDKLCRKFESGKRPKGGVQNIDKGIPSFGGEHLNSNGGFKFSKMKYIPESFYNSMSKGIIKEDNILIVKDGATTGKTSYVDKKFPYKKAAINEHVFLLEANEKIIPKYLFYYLFSTFGKRYVSLNFKGTAQGGINLSFFENTYVPYPNKIQQEAIIDKIEALFTKLDAGIHALEQMKIQLEKYRQSLLRTAVEGELTKKWREKNQKELKPASEEIKEILKERQKRWEETYLSNYEKKGKLPKDEKWKKKYNPPKFKLQENLFNLPEGWTWASPDQLSCFENYSLAIGPFGSDLKVCDYTDNGVPLVFVRHIRANQFHDLDDKFISDEKAAELKNHSVESGDILITKMGEPPGDACIYPENLPKAIITADCVKWRLHPLFLEKNLFIHFIHSPFGKLQISKITRGVAQKKMSLDRFKNILFPLPPLQEQTEICQKLDNNITQINFTHKELVINLERAKKLRNSILYKAFQGNLIQNKNYNKNIKNKSTLDRYL